MNTSTATKKYTARPWIEDNQGNLASLRLTYQDGQHVLEVTIPESKTRYIKVVGSLKAASDLYNQINVLDYATLEANGFEAVRS